MNERNEWLIWKSRLSIDGFIHTRSLSLFLPARLHILPAGRHGNAGRTTYIGDDMAMVEATVGIKTWPPPVRWAAGCWPRGPDSHNDAVVSQAQVAARGQLLSEMCR